MFADGIRIGEYGPDSETVAGWVEPSGKNPPWILWFNRDGSAQLYTKRKKNGAVVGKAIKLPAPKKR